MLMVHPDVCCAFISTRRRNNGCLVGDQVEALRKSVKAMKRDEIQVDGG